MERQGTNVRVHVLAHLMELLQPRRVVHEVQGALGMGITAMVRIETGASSEPRQSETQSRRSLR